MPRITKKFNLQRFNAVVGAIYFVCSLLGFFLMLGVEAFAAVPLWVMIVSYVVFVIFALFAASKFRENCFIQLAVYAAIAIPFGLIIEFFIMSKITAWTDGGDMVYRAGLICSLAIGVMTIIVTISPKCLLRIKRAGIVGLIAYIFGLFASVGIINSGVINIASIGFSAVAFAIVLYCWHVGASNATGVITIEDAVSMPASSFLAVIDKMQSFDDG